MSRGTRMGIRGRQREERRLSADRVQQRDIGTPGRLPHDDGMFHFGLVRR
jgi:hypothetical protein